MAKNGNRQIAALPFRKVKGKVEVLLITSRQTKRWVIPKGWPMDGLKDYNAARLEAFEEAGVGGRMRRKAIGHFSYEKRLADHTTKSLRVDVYVCAVTKLLSSWPEKQQRKRKWFAAEEAAELVHEAGLKKLILVKFGRAAKNL